MRASVDSGALLELVWAAPLAAVAVTIAMGLVVHGGTRAYEARRDGRHAAAAVHATVALTGATIFAAAVILGLVIMTAKG